MDFIADLSESIGAPSDLMKFLFIQLASIPPAILFRTKLSPSTTRPYTRRIVGALIGLFIVMFMFKWSTVHMIAQVLGVFVILRFLPVSLCHSLAFGFALGYLTWMHFRRLTDSDNYTSFFITYPIMSSTQKLTIIIMGSYDGQKRRHDNLTVVQRRNVLRKLPSLTEFLGYIFYFGGIVDGPNFFYAEYDNFITGKIVTKSRNKDSNEHFKDREIVVTDQHLPDPSPEVVKKVMISLAGLLVHVYLNQPISDATDPEFIASHGYLFRLAHIYLLVFLSKYKYIYSFKRLFSSAEAVQNTAGLGLYYVDGKPKWDLTSTMHLRNVHMPSSVSAFTGSWNIFAHKWLKYVVYARNINFRIFAVHFLSAVWHGLEPGLYVCFTGLGLFVALEHKLRRELRPHFVGTRFHRIYDIFTTMFYQVCITFTMGAFLIRSFETTLYFYTYSMYWSFYIIAICILLIPIPQKQTVKKAKKEL